MSRRRSIADWFSSGLGIGALTIVLALTIAPPTFLTWLSLNDGRFNISWARFGFRWYIVALFDERIQGALYRSLYVSGASAVAATALALVASIIFVHRYRLALLFLLVGLPIFVPAPIHGLAMSNSARSLSLGASNYLAVVAHSGYLLPYCSVILFISLANFPRSLLHVSMELGASRGYTLRRVLLPHAKGGIIASMCVGFLMSLNEHARLFYLTSEYLLPTYVYGKMRGGADPSVFALGSILYIVAVTAILLSLGALPMLSGPNLMAWWRSHDGEE